MKAEIAELWAQALESGKYQQTTGKLHRKIAEVEGVQPGLCCLGVLCELAVEAGVPVDRSENEYEVVYDKVQSVLPSSVQRWAGMHSSNGEYRPFVDYGNHGAALSSDNDSGAPFSVIAKTIRENRDVL